MDIFEPKSIRYRGELQKPFADCSSFPKVDFSKFDFPIKIIEDPMDIRVENEVFSAVRRVGVTVDKDELLRSLNYERDQYAAGYQAGLEAARPKWISVEERLPEESGSYLVCTRRSCAFTARFYLNTKEWKSHFAGPAGKHVTHWMPLPEPPKEET